MFDVIERTPVEHRLTPYDRWRLFLWQLEHEVPTLDNFTHPDGIDAREALELDLPV